jgi:hypothetical protein
VLPQVLAVCAAALALPLSLLETRPATSAAGLLQLLVLPLQHLGPLLPLVLDAQLFATLLVLLVPLAPVRALDVQPPFLLPLLSLMLALVVQRLLLSLQQLPASLVLLVLLLLLSALVVHSVAIAATFSFQLLPSTQQPCLVAF